jgi:hypothetical protein
MGRIANRTAVRVSVATVAAGVLAAGAFTDTKGNNHGYRARCSTC